ncbi:hypothetical protein BD413DRAFT_88802 [Trametes elegans]|nr:hypothetical protein BD413DRAFT_88802 [Trametes elegans]
MSAFGIVSPFAYPAPYVSELALAMDSREDSHVDTTHQGHNLSEHDNLDALASSSPVPLSAQSWHEAPATHLEAAAQPEQSWLSGTGHPQDESFLTVCVNYLDPCEGWQSYDCSANSWSAMNTCNRSSAHSSIHVPDAAFGRPPSLPPLMPPSRREIESNSLSPPTYQALPVGYLGLMPPAEISPTTTCSPTTISPSSLSLQVSPTPSPSFSPCAFPLPLRRSGTQPRRNAQVSREDFKAKLYPFPKWERWDCPFCGRDQPGARKPDFRRHLATHCAEGWAVLVELGFVTRLATASKKGTVVCRGPVSLGVANNAEEPRTVECGCQKVFSRRDALLRHLRAVCPPPSTEKRAAPSASDPSKTQSGM